MSSRLPDSSGRKGRVGHLLAAYYSRSDSQPEPASSDSRLETLSENQAGSSSSSPPRAGNRPASHPHLGVLLEPEAYANGSVVPLSESLESSQRVLSKEIKILNQQVGEETYSSYRLLVQTCTPSTGILSTVKVGRYQDHTEAVVQAVSKIDKDYRTLASCGLRPEKMRRITELAITRELMDSVTELLRLDEMIASLTESASTLPKAMEAYEGARTAVEAVPALRSSPAIVAVLARASDILVKARKRIGAEEHSSQQGSAAVDLSVSVSDQEHSPSGT